METGKRNHLIFQIASFLFLAVCLLGTINYVRLKMSGTLTADDSSEMVLADLLASENSLVTKNWHYSTEVSVLNTNIIYSFFFHFSDNWHRVRLFSIISMYLILLLVYYGMSRVFHFRRYFALTAAVLFLPISDVYYYFILQGAYYFPVITTSVFLLFLGELYLNSTGWKASIVLIFSFLFSIPVGLGGARQLMITYIPLLGAACILLLLKTKMRKSGKWLLYTAVIFFGCMIGFEINSKVLSEILKFESWHYIHFANLNFDRVAEVLNGILWSFGYSAVSVFSSAFLKNLVCACWILLTVASVWYALRNQQLVSEGYFRLAVFTAVSYLIFIVFYTFTDMYLNSRYNYPIVCLSFPLIALYLEENGWKKIAADGLLWLLAAAAAICGVLFYSSQWNRDDNVEIRRISRELVSHGYFNGYSTFWTSNNLTEFSNGKIEVWHWIDNGTGKTPLTITDVDRTYKWLQKTSHDDTHPAGKVFILLTTVEYNNNFWTKNQKEEDVIYRSENYVISGYENYEEMIDHLYSDYDYVFGEGQWIKNGKDVDGHREIGFNGESYGPYITVWPGKYEITAEGEGLSESKIFCTSEKGAAAYEITPVENDDEVRRYSLEVSEKAPDFEVVVRNMSEDRDSVIRLDAIHIRRVIE